MIDYHKNVWGYKTTNVKFDNYSKRKNNFLTKSQEELINFKKEEQAMRNLKMQKLKSL